MAFRRLLKDVTTGLYYDGKGGWTPDAAIAQDFADSHQAIKTFQRLNKANLHLVLKFPDSRMDVSHALGEPNAPRPRRGLDTPLIITGLLPAAVQAVHLVRKLIS